ncbi:AarF/ABC1/UbiB kinase family protein [Candidatus Dependentiae bacterium]|nr:AarF/ABC1/UbiB kinase family protein [Candidatus Dependentiae bacterium]
MPTLKNKYKSIKRWSEVIEIIVKNGLGFLLSKLQLGYHYLGKRMKRKVVSGEDIPASNIVERIRKSFEELGPSFIKLGQMLSTRPDIIPITLCEELKKLQDKVTPLPYSSLESTLIEAYGKNYKEQFDYIDENALASASLAQVHRAKLKKEQIEVVLKIQKPNLESIIEGDIQIMKDFAGLMKKYEFGTDVLNPDLVVDEFKKNITEEINFIFEARNTERVRESFAGDDQIIIPEVFWDYSSRKVMVTKFIAGRKLNEIDFDKEPEYDAEILINRGMSAFLKMIFEDGFFHGDPHPGNIIVTHDKKVALVDFGIIGRLDQRTRNLLVDVFIGVIYRDIERVVYSFEDLGVIEEGIEIKELKYDISSMLEKYYDIPLGDLVVKDIIEEAIEKIEKYNIKIPRNLYILIKTMVTLEGIGKEIYPDFNIMSSTKYYAKKMIKDKYSPLNFLNETRRGFWKFRRFLMALPDDLNMILKKTKKGQLKIEFEHKNLEKLVTGLDHLSNRIAFSLIISSLIVSSSLLMNFNVGPKIFGISVLGLIGYIIAGVLGLFLIIVILRSGKY